MRARCSGRPRAATRRPNSHSASGPTARGAHIAAMAAAMGGLDVLAISGGVGEHLPAMRERMVRRLSFLGIAVDPDRNAGADGGDVDISGAAAAVSTVVVTAREDLIVAEQVWELLDPSRPAPGMRPESA